MDSPLQEPMAESTGTDEPKRGNPPVLKLVIETTSAEEPKQDEPSAE